MTRGSLVLALAVVLQYAILVRISFRGSHADFMVLLPFGAGYVAGPERGAAFGFVSGLVADLFLPTPFGMSALVGCLVGYLSGMAASGLVRPAWWVPLFGGVGATAISLCDARSRLVPCPGGGAAGVVRSRASRGPPRVVGASPGRQDPAVLRRAGKVSRRKRWVRRIGPADGTPRWGGMGVDGAASSRSTRSGPLPSPKRLSSNWSSRLVRHHVNPRSRLHGQVQRRAPRAPRMRPRRSLVRKLFVQAPGPGRPALRLKVVGLVVFALFAGMVLRLWYLQVLDSSSFSQVVVSNQVRAVSVSPPRGLIVSRSGSVLAGDRVTEAITLSRVAAVQHPGVVGRLAALIGAPPAQVQALLADPRYSPYRPVPILTNAPLSDLVYIREHAGEFPGVSAVAQSVRTYPQGTTAAHLLGYLGQITQAELAALKGQGYQQGDQIGQSGVEASFQKWLRGTPGTKRLEVDAQGQ
ncbi:MAG: hypothetical protein ACYCUF_09700, partial [Acidimicrobiales bacterium]